MDRSKNDVMNKETIHFYRMKRSRGSHTRGKDGRKWRQTNSKL